MTASIATRTIGCNTVAAEPPPNLKFSGCTYLPLFNHFRKRVLADTAYSSTRIQAPDVGSYCRISFAGLPAITLKGGKLFVTTEFAPTTLFLPKTSWPFEQTTTTS